MLNSTRFALAFTMLCLVSIALEAQINSCKAQVTCATYNMYYAECIPPLPPGAGNCHYNGPWSMACEIATDQCTPMPCPTCNKARAGHPIDLATGNVDIQQSDVVLAGLGGGLALTRTWNSTLGSNGYGKFGMGWRSNVEERIYVGGDGLIKHARGDGSIASFGWHTYTPAGDGSVYYPAGPRNGDSTLQVDATKWTLTQRNGDKKVFDRAGGSLSSLIDRNGNTTQVSYDSANHRIMITDPASRHLYLTYSSLQVFSFYVDLVTSVTSDFGVSLSYQYDTLGRLVKVTKPDNTFVTFEYGAGDFITAVKDSEGKVLESHTYDGSGRGLTSSRAGGVDSLSVSYEP